MKIDRIDVHNLRFEYAPEHRFQYGGGRCTARVTTLVAVYTACGQVGFGSAYTHPAIAHLVIKHQLEPLLRGRNATDVEAMWRTMYGVTRWYGRKGAAMSALGALDTAFWDLRGKARGEPVWAMLGGKGGTCPAYASALLWKDDPAELAAEAAALVARGFHRVKMRMGKSEAYDTQAVAIVREAIGPDRDMMADAGMRYHVDLARRVGRALEAHRVFWFEEPFAPEDLDAYAALRGTVGVPIAAGENEFGVQGFAELIHRGAVDIVQPDASRCGGLSEVVRTAHLAGEAGLRFAPHTWSDALAVVANAHVVAAMPHGLTVEIDQTGNPFIDTLLREPLVVRDGMLDLGDRPGLGVEPDMSVVDRLRIADPLDVPDGTYSDMVFGAAHLTPAGPYEELS